MINDNALSKKLSKFHKKKYCIIAGNATTSIYLILKSLSLKNKVVAMPNSVCQNVHLAITLAKKKHLFIDCDSKNYGISLKYLKKYKNVSVVIAPHCYGVPCNIKELRDYCMLNKIFLIEDAAMVQGGFYKNNLLGFYGDASVLSFGKEKVIDCGIGGAILTDNVTLYKKIIENKKKLKKYNQYIRRNINMINHNYKKIYNNYYLNNEFSKLKSQYNKNVLSFMNNLIFDINENKCEEISEKFNKINQIIDRRRKKYSLALETFNKFRFKNIKVLKLPSNAIPWKFNILIKFNRNKIFKEILKKNIPISSWYAPNNIFFKNAGKADIFPISYNISSQILNISIDNKSNKKYFLEVFNLIKSYQS